MAENEICGTCKFYMETKPGNYCINPKGSRAYKRVGKDYYCKSWREGLTALSEYIHRPKITLDGREYVDKESFVNLILSRMLQERKYCDSKKEETGIDVCRRIIENL